MRRFLFARRRTITLGFGDSITNGYGASDEAHKFLSIIATRFHGTKINAGINGTVLQNTVQNTVNVIGGPAGNNGRDTYLARVVAQYPFDHCLILYGLNDIRLNDVAFTVALFENDLGEVVDGIIAGTGIRPNCVIIGSPPYVKEASYANDAPQWNAGSRIKHASYTASCAAVAAAKGVGYVDVFQWMSDHGGDALLLGDGIHPNDNGYAAIATAFLSVM